MEKTWEFAVVMQKYRNIDRFLKGDGDDQVKVRHDGSFHTSLGAKERIEVTEDVRRRHTKFLQILVDEFGNEPFRRWDLDTGRISYLLNREIKYAGIGNPNPNSSNQFLVLDFAEILTSFPEVNLPK